MRICARRRQRHARCGPSHFFWRTQHHAARTGLLFDGADRRMRTRLCPRPAPRRRSETRARSKARAAGRRQSGSLRRPAPSGKRRSRCARRSAAHASRTSARALFCHRPRSPCGPCAGKGPGPGGRLQGSCRNCTQTPNQGLCGEMTPARARKRARPFHALMPCIGSLTKSGCAARGSSSGRSGLFFFTSISVSFFFTFIC